MLMVPTNWLPSFAGGSRSIRDSLNESSAFGSQPAGLLAFQVPVLPHPCTTPTTRCCPSWVRQFGRA